MALFSLLSSIWVVLFFIAKLLKLHAPEKCVSCKTVIKDFRKASKKLGASLRFGTIDVSQYPELGRKMGVLDSEAKIAMFVRCVPTFSHFNKIAHFLLKKDPNQIFTQNLFI